MIVIPAIDLMDGNVVRLYKGDPDQKTIYSSNPVHIAKRWESAGADMLHLVDLDATLGRGTNLGTIKKILKSVSIPVQVAGGLRDESLVTGMAGISERIVIGTLAFNNESLLKSLLSGLGPEKIVISIDHRDGQIVINGWQQGTGIGLISSLERFLGMGFTEFLLTNVNRDGTMQGPDLEFLEQACAFSDANIIASGGISNIGDVQDVRNRGASGVILGKALYEGAVSIGEAKGFS